VPKTPAKTIRLISGSGVVKAEPPGSNQWR
jgi:hypothetical protein